MTEKHLTFRNKTLREIRLWARIAASLLLATVIGLWLVWMYGTASLFSFLLTVGLSVAGLIFLGWWWWALRAIKTLIAHWDEIGQDVKHVADEIKSLRTFIQVIFQRPKDK
jgi:ABC-type xylose transport system permease subunit